MRTFTFILLLALLAVCVSAVRLSDAPSSSHSLGVPVPYKWCGASTDDATIDSITSNEFPPVKGDNLVLNVTGNLTKVVTSGTYTIAISVSGFPLPSITGDIDAFSPLPWALGELNFTYSQEIPSEAPPGSYQVKISAVDQDSKQIFCISIAFSLSADKTQNDLTLQAVQSRADQLMAEQRMTVEAKLNQQRPTSKIPLLSNLRRPKMPAMKPMKSNRRL